MSKIRMLRPAVALAAPTAFYFVISAGPAFAYVDPGAAAMLITAVLGAFATIGYTLRSYWSRFKGLFKRRRDAGEQ